jgi:glutamate 5-kinase
MKLNMGDNDRLAARVAQITGADCLILLSNINGLYSSDPRNNQELKLIDSVESIDDDIESMVGKSITETGKGGMKTKIMAAKTALSAGCHMAITNGTIDNPYTSFIQWQTMYLVYS